MLKWKARAIRDRRVKIKGRATIARVFQNSRHVEIKGMFHRLRRGADMKRRANVSSPNELLPAKDSLNEMPRTFQMTKSRRFDTSQSYGLTLRYE